MILLSVSCVVIPFVGFIISLFTKRQKRTKEIMDELSDGLSSLILFLIDFEFVLSSSSILLMIAFEFLQYGNFTTVHPLISGKIFTCRTSCKCMVRDFQSSHPQKRGPPKLKVLTKNLVLQPARFT